MGLCLSLHCDLVFKGPLAPSEMAPMSLAFSSVSSCLPLSFPQNSGPQGGMNGVMTEGTSGNQDPFLHICLRSQDFHILPSLSYPFLGALHPLLEWRQRPSPLPHTPQHCLPYSRALRDLFSSFELLTLDTCTTLELHSTL